MQKQPLVSFIVTAHNVNADTLLECIESITSLSLSLQEREIILVDDGSTVTPLNELAEYADQLTYIRQRHQGLSAARNTGMRMATGRFLQFVNGTDRLIRAQYEHCLDMARYHDPDVVLFISTKKDNFVEPPFKYCGPTTGSSYMRDNNIHGAAYNYLFERKAIGNLKFTSTANNEDEEFVTQLLIRSERFYSTDSEAYYHNDVDSHISRNDMQPALADTERMLVHLQELVVPEADRAALNRRIAQLTMEYLCDIIRCTHDNRQIKDAIERLRDKGLYPLPDRNYTKKYKYFRIMIGSAMTRPILVALIRNRLHW